jgi:hypothetical protein
MAANRASLLKVHRLLMFGGVRKVVAKWLNVTDALMIKAIAFG